MLPVYRPETARPGGADNGILAALGGNKHSVQMNDGDGCFDLDNWEYGSDFGAPIDQSSGEAVVMMRRVLVGPGPVYVRFALRLGLGESRTR